AEESRTPQKDIPFGIIASLIVCTILYVGVALVLLGMMKYKTFVMGDAANAPVAYALRQLGARPVFQAIIIIGALMVMISSLPVFPLISVVLCVSLMSGLLLITWVRFFVWLLLGLLVYFFYSRHRSEFAR